MTTYTSSLVLSKNSAEIEQCLHTRIAWIHHSLCLGYTIAWGLPGSCLGPDISTSGSGTDSETLEGSLKSSVFLSLYYTYFIGL